MVLRGAAEHATARNTMSWELPSSKGTNSATDPMAMQFQGLREGLQKAEESVSSCRQGVEVSWEQSAKRLSFMESGVQFLMDQLIYLNNQVQTMTDSSASNTSGPKTGLSADVSALVVTGSVEKLEPQLGLLRIQLNQRLDDLTSRMDELAQLKVVTCRVDALEEQALSHSQRLEQLQVAQSFQKTSANCGTFETDQSSKETLASLQSRVDKLAKLLSTEAQLRETSISKLEWHFHHAHAFLRRPPAEEHCDSTSDMSTTTLRAEALASNVEVCGPEGPAAATTASDLVAPRGSQCTELRQGVPSQASGSGLCSTDAAGEAAGGDASDGAAALIDTARAHGAESPVKVVVPVSLLLASPSKNSVSSSAAPTPSNISFSYTSPPTRRSSATLSPATSGNEGRPLPLSPRAVTATVGSPSHTSVTPLSATPNSLRTDVRRSSSMPPLAAVPPGSRLSRRCAKTARGGTSSTGHPIVGNRVLNDRTKPFERASETVSSHAMISRQSIVSSTQGRGAGAGGQSCGCLLASTNSPPPPRSLSSGASQGVQLSPGSRLLAHATATALPLALGTAAGALPLPMLSPRHVGSGRTHHSWSSPLHTSFSTPVPALPGPSTAVGF